jgi:hypothetical protein
VAQILANLEKQLAFHREKEAYHAEQEVFHREQRAAQAAEVETVSKHYEAFKATAGDAAAIAARTATAPPPKPEASSPPVRLEPVRPHKLVARLVAELPQGENFTATKVAAEVNRRYQSELKKPIDRPTASTCLRRMVADGRIHLVKKGTAHIPAVYKKA